VLIGIAWNPPVASAAPFTVSITGTGTNVHLKATTVPACRLVRLKGDRLDAITNVVQIEGGAMLQPDLVVASGVSAAFTGIAFTIRPTTPKRFTSPRPIM
jgi:hypothetical protein